MEVVYIDVLALLNLAIDYLLLAATARLAGRFVPRWRLALGALLGAAFAVLSVLPVPELLLGLPARLAVGLLMVLVVFGRHASIGRLFALFLAASCALAGGTTALWLATGTKLSQGGVYYFEVPSRVALGVCALSYAAAGLLFRGAAKHGVAQSTTETVVLTAFQKTARFTLLLDSGCDLTDPISGRPVLVLERAAAARLLPAELRFVCAALPSGAAETFTRLPEQYRASFRLLPYHAVGTEGGLLLMFRPQLAARQDGKPFETYVAISPHRIANGRYEGLIGV